MQAQTKEGGDLGHWDTKDELTINEAIWLAVGEDPIAMSQQLRDANGRILSRETNPKQQLLLTHAMEGFERAHRWVRALVQNCQENPLIAEEFRRNSCPGGWIPISGKSKLPGSPGFLVSVDGSFPVGRVGLLPTMSFELLVWPRLGEWTVERYDESVPKDLDGDALIERWQFQEWLDRLGWRCAYVFDAEATKSDESSNPTIDAASDDLQELPVNGKQRQHYLKVIAGLLEVARIPRNEIAAEVLRRIELSGQVSLDRATFTATLKAASSLRPRTKPTSRHSTDTRSDTT
jgi:hypothetical protein